MPRLQGHTQRHQGPIAFLLALVISGLVAAPDVQAQAPSPQLIPGTVPGVVKENKAQFKGHHDPADTLELSIGLPPRNDAALTQFLTDAATPGSSQYHHWLTLAQENALYNPTVDQESAVTAWARSHGLRVVTTYVNHLVVMVQGTTDQVENTLSVKINDYSVTEGGTTRAVFAPDRDPSVDASIAPLIRSIVGLDNLTTIHHLVNGSTNPYGNRPYYPQDYANAYDVTAMWNAGYTGVGQHIAIVLAEPAPLDTTLQNYYNVTHANVATRANGRLKIITPVDTTEGASYEGGLDIEAASGQAPGATIDYYQIAGGNYIAQSTVNVLQQAGTDSNNNQQISASWGSDCEPGDTLHNQLEPTLKANEATGHDYLFASGDSGFACPNLVGPYVAGYPASSPWVTSVGGTSFTNRVGGGYPGESAWANSGGGFSQLFSRPLYQTGPGMDVPDTSQNHCAVQPCRAYPDISAAADPSTAGAYVCSDYSPGLCANPADPTSAVGGTSLACPMWAGWLADTNQYLQANGGGSAGFINPTIYTFYWNPPPYPTWHDILSGSNGYFTAGSGWDPVTGLGTPDVWNFARDMLASPAKMAAIYPHGQPNTFAPSSSRTWDVTVVNTGKVVWKAHTSTSLDIHFETSGGTSLGDYVFQMPIDVQPGNSVTIGVSPTAPYSPGTYVLQYGMTDVGSAGFYSKPLRNNVTVGTVQSLDAGYWVSGAPNEFGAGSGSSIPFQIKLYNTGSTTWNASGTNPVLLGIHFFLAGSATWQTDQRIPLPFDVAPNQTTTLTIQVTAPPSSTTPGQYLLGYQMVKSNVAWFSSYLNTVVCVGMCK